MQKKKIPPKLEKKLGKKLRVKTTLNKLAGGGFVPVYGEKPGVGPPPQKILKVKIPTRKTWESGFLGAPPPGPRPLNSFPLNRFLQK